MGFLCGQNGNNKAEYLGHPCGVLGILFSGMAAGRNCGGAGLRLDAARQLMTKMNERP